MSATNAKRVRGAARVAITANRLRDGAVVWWRGEAGWSIHFHDAAPVPAEAAADALAAAKRDEAARIIVGTYATPLTEAGLDAWGPDGWKERIRAFGPSIDVPGGLHGQG